MGRGQFWWLPLLAALQTTLYTLKAKWSINIGKSPRYQQGYQGKGISQEQINKSKKTTNKKISKLKNQINKQTNKQSKNKQINKQIDIIDIKVKIFHNIKIYFCKKKICARINFQEMILIYSLHCNQR